MKSWEDVLVAPDAPLREALAAIDRGRSQIALVVDADRRLLGTLSDGDVRRALLRGTGLDAPASACMNPKPTTGHHGAAREVALATMRSRGLHQLPLLDAQGVVRGLEVVDDFFVQASRPNEVVIMAGGLGTRLKELTAHTPKPMLRVGSRPLLETIVLDYLEQGFARFSFAVNYKAEQIEAHFGDGSRLGATIRYLREEERLGTAGALSLLPERPTAPLIVTNADLLVKCDYAALVDAHERSGALATMAVRDYEMQVPFGVVREQGGRIEAIEEKPVQSYVVSAGLYVLSPAALDYVPARRFFDMPQLFAALLADGKAAQTYRLDGYWLDIGRLPDFERANAEFKDVFG